MNSKLRKPSKSQKKSTSKKVSTAPAARLKAPAKAESYLGAIESRYAEVISAKSLANKYGYFVRLAEARFVLRKVARIFVDEAKAAGLDPLDHQAMMQIYGSPSGELTVGKLAERLDIVPPFASNLLRGLTNKGLIARRQDKSDQRITHVSVTDTGRTLLEDIDAKVHFHLEYFSAQLTPAERESAVALLMLFVNPKNTTWLGR